MNYALRLTICDLHALLFRYKIMIINYALRFTSLTFYNLGLTRLMTNLTTNLMTDLRFMTYPITCLIACTLLVGESKAQAPCPPLRASHRTICYGENNPDVLNHAFQVEAEGKLPHARILWHWAEDGIHHRNLDPIVNSRGDESLVLTAADFISSGPPEAFYAQPAGKLHHVKVGQIAPGCSLSELVSVYVLQQPQLSASPLLEGPALPANIHGERLCNGTSVTLKSAPPLAKTVAAGQSAQPSAIIHIPAEIYWASADGVNFNESGRIYSTEHAAVSFDIQPEPTPNAERTFSYQLRYSHQVQMRITNEVRPPDAPTGWRSPLARALENMRPQECARPSGNLTVKVWPKPSQTGSLDPPSQDACMGVAYSLSLTGSNSGQGEITVPLWERALVGNTGYTAYIPTVGNLTLTESAPAPAVYRYRAKLERNNGTGSNGRPNPVCEAYSAPATVTVHKFDMSPLSDRTVCAGDTAHFESVIISPGRPLTSLVWKVNKGDGLGFVPDDTGTPRIAPNSKYRLDFSRIPGSYNNYIYRAEANNGICVKTTPEATLRALAAPAITEELPLERHVCRGESQNSFRLSVSVAGDDASNPSAYRWQQKRSNESDFSDAFVSGRHFEGNANHLTGNESMVYRAIVSRGSCSAPGREFTVYAHNPPHISSDWGSYEADACRGSIRAFTANAASDHGLLTYEWSVARGNLESNATVLERSNHSTFSVRLPYYAGRRNYPKYIVKVSDRYCAAYRATRFSVRPSPPVAKNLPSNPLLCAGQNITLDAGSALPGESDPLPEGTNIPPLVDDVPGESDVSYQWQEAPPGTSVSTFRNLEGQRNQRLSLHEVQSDKNGWRYRAVAVNSFSCADTTNIVVLTVGAPPAVSLGNTAVCRGEAYEFTPLYGPSEGTLRYQWQAETAGVFEDVPGATTASYRIANPQTTTRYKVLVRLDGTNCRSESPPATLTVNPNPSVALGNKTVCAGEVFDFFPTSVTGGTPNYAYQWQVGGTTLDGAASHTLRLPRTNSPLNAGSHTVTLTVTDSKGCHASSSVALTVKALPSFGTQPAATAACSGNPVAFSVTAGETGCTYQWLEAAPTGTFAPIPANINSSPTGSASASLTLPQVPAGKNGYRYKALLTKNGCTAESAEVTLTVIDPVISITPQSGVVCEGNAHTYTANASSGTPAGYQWKKWNETTRVFDNISGATNATYEIGQVARIHEGQYAAAVTFGSNLCTKTSAAATLHVNASPVVVTPPSDQTVCHGESAAFTVVGDTPHGTLTYQWEEAVSAVAAFSPLVSERNPTLSFTGNLAIAKNGYRYRVVLSNGLCSQVTAPVAPAVLTVKAKPVPGTPLANGTVCAGTEYEFTSDATCEDGTLTYQWQEKYSNVFRNVGSDNNRYKIANPKANSIYKVIVRRSDLPHCLLESGQVTLTVRSAPALALNEQPVDQTICAKASVSFSVPSRADVSFKWQEAAPDTEDMPEGGFADIVGNPTATTHTLTLNLAPDAKNRYRYRVILTRGLCTFKSNEARLTLNAAISTQPSNQTVCSNGQASFSATAQANSNYQWQESADGIFFVNIPGETTAAESRCTVLNPAEKKNYRYRVLASRAACTNASEEAILTVNSAPDFHAPLPDEALGCAGSSYVYKANAYSSKSIASDGKVTYGTTGISYRWERALPNSNSFSETGGNTENYIVANITEASQHGARYRVAATVGGCSKESNISSFNVVTTGEEVFQLAPSRVCNGDNAVFTVGSAGTNSQNGTYQWSEEQNGTPPVITLLPGETTNTLTISPVTTAHNGRRYHSVFRFGACQITSVANLVVVNPPQIAPFGNAGVCAGDTHTYTASFTNPPPGNSGQYRYQWTKTNENNIFENIPGATDRTYVAERAFSTATYALFVTIQGTGCTRNFRSTLTVNPPPAISALADKTICPDNDQSAVFSVTAEASRSYQWEYKPNGASSFTALPVLPTDPHRYTVPSPSEKDGYRYQVKVTNTQTNCAHISNPAVLRVIRITGETNNFIPDKEVCASTPFNLRINAGGGTDQIGYQWKKKRRNTDGTFQTPASYENVGDALLSYSGSTLRVTETNNRDVYRATITYNNSHCPTSTDKDYTIRVKRRPSFDIHPTDRIVCEGMLYTSFSAHAFVPLSPPATTSPVPTYQWMYTDVNGNDFLLGPETTTADASTQQVPNIGLATHNKNRYRVRAFFPLSPSGICSTDSNPAQLTVISQQTAIRIPRVSLTINKCTNDTVSFKAKVTPEDLPANLSYRWQKAPIGTDEFENISSAELPSNGLTSAHNGKYKVLLNNVTCSNFESNAVTLMVHPNYSVGAPPVSETICAGSQVIFTVTAAPDPDSPLPTTYQWQAASSATGEFFDLRGETSSTLRFTGVPAQTLTGVQAQNGHRYRALITSNGYCRSDPSTPATLTLVTPPAPPAVVNGEICSGMPYTFSVTPRNGESYRWLKENDDGVFSDAGSNPYAETNTTFVQGGSNRYRYRVRAQIDGVSGCQTLSEPATLTVNPLPSASFLPSNNPPTCQGRETDLSAAAGSGTPGYVYQWYLTDNTTTPPTTTLISGAAGPALRLPAPGLPLDGTYTVRVTDSKQCRAETSTTLTINTPPSITAQPENKEICANSNTPAFSVTAPPQTGLTFKWQESAPPSVPGGALSFADVLPAATSSTFSLSGVPIAKNGYRYRAVLTVPECASVESEPAVLTVNPLPRLSATAPIACAGGEATLRALATGGTSSYTYEWREGTALLGSGQTLPLSNLPAPVGEATERQQTYTVKVTDSKGCHATASPTLTVRALPAIVGSPVVAPAAVCGNGRATFTLPPRPALAWQWEAAPGATAAFSNIPGASENSYTVNPAAGKDGYRYRATVKDAHCSSAAGTAATLRVLELPNIREALNPVSVCPGNLTTSFNITPPVPAPASYRWEINTGPQGAFENITTAVPNGSPRQPYTISADNAARRSVYRYRTAVTYRDVLNGNPVVCHDTSASLLRIGIVPVVFEFTPRSESICSGGRVRYSVTAISAAAPLRYQWQQQNRNTGTYENAGEPTGQSTFEMLNAREPEYKTRVQVFDNNGCSATSPEAALTVKPLPEADVDPSSPRTICSGESTDLRLINPNNIPGTSYAWEVPSPPPASVSGLSGGSSLLSGRPAIEQKLTSAAREDVTVRYIVTPSANGCEGASKTVDVTVHPRPDALAIAERTAICSGGSAVIHLTSPGEITGVKYKWTASSTAVTGGQTQITPVDGPIRHTLTLQSASLQDGEVRYTITPSAANCEGTPISAVITVQSPLRIAPAQPIITACPGGEIRLTREVVAGSSVIQYQWWRGDQRIAGATSPSYLKTAEESDDGARFRLAAANPCTASEFSGETVLTLDNESVFGNARIRASALAPECLAPVTFSYEGVPAASFSWDFGDNTPLSAFASPVHNYTEPGKKIVRATVVAQNRCRKTLPLELEVKGKINDPYTIDMAGIGIYPVPLEEKLNVRWGKRILSVSLSTMLGVTIRHWPQNGTHAVLDTSTLTPGTYLLWVETENEISRFKVVK